MDKDEILARSRKEMKDEGMEHAVNQGRRIGVAGMSVVLIIIVIYNLIRGLNNNAVFAMFWTYIGLDYYAKYRYTRGKNELVGTVAGIIAGVMFLASYILSTWVQ